MESEGSWMWVGIFLTSSFLQIQEQMDEATAQLEEKEYNASSGGGAVNVTVTGKVS